MPEADLVIRNLAELWCFADGDGPVRGDAWAELSPIEDAGVAVVDGRIAAAGPGDEIDGWTTAAGGELDGAGLVCVPGLVDAHTHPVFGGHRAWELDAKLRGATYDDLLARGGGINATVEATRAASSDELVADACDRVRGAMAAGATTMEAKSGYDLTPEGELGLLAAIAEVGERSDTPTLVPTLLGAHLVPNERAKDRAAFIDEIAVVADEAASRGLARFVDAFVDRGALTVDEGRRVLEAGRDAGLGVRVHADELTRTGAARMGVELGAASVDHCNHVNDDDIALLADSDTVATLCPATPFGSLGTIPYAPARALIDAGCAVALGSDMNPNAYNESMVLTMRLATFMMGMRPVEALAAATVNAAASLGLDDGTGRIVEGGPADLVLLRGPTLDWTFYRFGRAAVEGVVRAGRPV